MSIRSPLAGLLGWILLSFAAAAVGGVASANAGDFYQQLAKPGWAPPAGLFGPVWTVLYLLMGVAAWLVWKARGFGAARGALLLFLLQLAANALWTWLFFAWRHGGLAFAEILVLWVLIAATIVAFRRVSGLAALLLVPYLAWVSFAACLTYAVWQRNPQLLASSTLIERSPAHASVPAATQQRGQAERLDALLIDIRAALKARS